MLALHHHPAARQADQQLPCSESVFRRRLIELRGGACVSLKRPNVFGIFQFWIVFVTESVIFEAAATLRNALLYSHAARFYATRGTSRAVTRRARHVSGPGEGAGTTQGCPCSLWTIFEISKNIFLDRKFWQQK